jgi:hypothetical protein
MKTNISTSACGFLVLAQEPLLERVRAPGPPAGNVVAPPVHTLALARVAGSLAIVKP